jgi:DNA-binding transcriptional ArsR family regulator
VYHNVLAALMDGQALTAGELAWHAGVSAQIASGHLARRIAAHLLAVERQGRHRYHRLVSPEVARATESSIAAAVSGPKRHRPTRPRDEALRRACTCYDHLAGRLGTALADSLRANGHVVVGDDGGAITDRGIRFLRDALGIDLSSPSGRPLCRTCLDWSERRPHFAGRLGAALCRRSLDLGWITRARDSRAVAITPAGREAFAGTFGIVLP